MQELTALIIDDEPNARQLLKHLLNENCAEVKVLAECDNLPNGVKAIRKLKPDLVFLDIEMPGHSGLELLDFFEEKEITFGIIFTTAYNQYAVQAFKLSATDYLLKPIDEVDLKNAVNRFIKNQFAEKQQLQVLKENLSAHGHKKIAVPIAHSIKFIDIDTIVVLKADNTYTEIYLTTGEKLVASRTLKNFEDSLSSGGQFIRVQKSYMVNKNHITSIEKSDGGYCIMNNKMQVPVSSDKISFILEEHQMINR